MPQFKVAKTDNIDKLNNKELQEDKLYIYKETNEIGRLYYDYGIDDKTQKPIRLEIGTLDNIYKCIDDISEDVVTVNINSLRKYSSTEELSIVSIDEIRLNSLVTTNKSLYNIRNIDRDKNIITVRKIYMQHDLEWNDYYYE